MLIRVIVALSFVAALLTGFAHADGWVNYSTSIGDGPQIVGSGTLKTESRALQGFNAIHMKDPSDVQVEIGPRFSVSVTSDDNLLPLVETRLDGDTLVIESKGSYRSHHAPKIKVVMPALSALQVSGSGDALIRGLDGGAVKLAVAGSGDIEAAGRIDELNIRIDGSGDVNAEQLKATKAKVEVDGSGDANLTASDTLDAVVNGSGDIRYGGHPSHVSNKIHGSGDISTL